MIPILLLILLTPGELPVVERIEFRDLPACQAAAERLARELITENMTAIAVCIDRISPDDRQTP